MATGGPSTAGEVSDRLDWEIPGNTYVQTAEELAYLAASLSDRDVEELADSIARALNAAEIPCVLWGEYLWSAHGIPCCHSSLDFVIPDAKLAAAREVISTSTDFTRNLVACQNTMTCSQSYSDRPWPISAFHLHIEKLNPRRGNSVGLFLQSETLWFLPPFSASLANPRANPLPPYLVLASDPTALPHHVAGMGKGVHTSDRTVVLVPKAHILLEAAMRIVARDHGTTAGTFSMSVVGYMDQYVRAYGFLNIDLLPVPLKVLYKSRFKPSPREWLVKLKRYMRIPVEDSEYR